MIFETGGAMCCEGRGFSRAVATASLMPTPRGLQSASNLV